MKDKFDEKMGPMYITSGNGLDIYQQLQIDLIFDQCTDQDIQEIELEMKQVALLKKVCWVKVMSYPQDWLLSYFLLGKSWAKERVEEHKVYKEFLRNKLTIKEFNTKLMDISNKHLKGKNKDA